MPNGIGKVWALLAVSALASYARPASAQCVLPNFDPLTGAPQANTTVVCADQALQELLNDICKYNVPSPTPGRALFVQAEATSTCLNRLIAFTRTLVAAGNVVQASAAVAEIRAALRRGDCFLRANPNLFFTASGTPILAAQLSPTALVVMAAQTELDADMFCWWSLLAMGAPCPAGTPVPASPCFQ